MWPVKKEDGCVTHLYLDLMGVEGGLPVKFGENFDMHLSKLNEEQDDLLPTLHRYALVCRGVERNDAILALHSIVECLRLSSGATINVKEIGTGEPVVYRGSELDISKNIKQPTYEVISKKSVAFAASTAPKLMVYRNNDRFNRLSNALHLHLTALLALPDAALVLHIGALEGLFVQSNQELSHRLALAIAWYLEGEDGSARYELYEQMRMLYNYRSKVVHGDKIDSDEEQAAIKLVENLVPMAEELTRRCICAIFERNHHEFISQTKKLDDFFALLELGFSPTEAMERIR